MQLERREAIELVLSSRASLLSEVATRLSVSEGKTTQPEKSYKDSGALDLKHREASSCGREELGPYLSCTTYRIWIDFLIQVRARWALLNRNEI